MAEIRINTTGGLKLYDADNSHYAQIVAGTITSNVDAITLGHDTVTIADNLSLGSDSAILKFGADTEIALTHVADTGLKLTDSGGTPTLQLHDANESIASDGSKVIITSGGTAFSLPTSDGSSGQVLSTNGSGVLSFATASSADPSSADGDSLGTASAEWSDLFLADGGIIYFGNDQDVALIHNADKGLKLKSTATSDDTPAIFTLQTGDTDIGDADVIGKIEFQAPDEGTGTDAILVGAAIQAVAVGDFSSSANAMELQFMTAESAAASAKMRIRGDGKVGISPDGAAPDLGTGLHIRTSDSSASVASGMDELVLENGSANCGLSILTANDALARIAFADPQDNGAGGIDYDHGSNMFKVIAAGSGNLFVQSDRVGVGTGGNTDDARVHIETPNQQCIKTQRPGTSNSGHITFVNDNGVVGEITTNGSTTTFATSSDYRLKENVDYTWNATTRLKQLKPARFNWIADDTNTLVDGFLAHEVSSIVPEAISKTKDATKTLTNVVLDANGKVINSKISKDNWEHGKKEDEDGNRIFPADSTWESSKEVPDYQTIDESKLVSLLVKTVQELEARITTLEG
jgi:hypothetical protein